MKEIFYNHDNLKQNEIDETVTRLKALIINSNDEILLGYSHKTYQFPGGHLEENERLIDALKRELREETGMVFDELNINPFQLIRYYCKNYRNTGKNRENLIYYYLINTDKEFDLDNTSYDEYEKDGNYELKRIKLDNVKNVLLDSMEDNPINKTIVEEMLAALENKK